MASLTKLIFIHLVWFFSLTDAQMPSLNLVTLQRLSPCVQGLRASKDRFLIEGSAETRGTNATQWPRTFVFEIGHNETGFETLCTIRLAVVATVGTGCISIPKTSEKYSVAINKTAESHMSGLSGRLRWNKYDASTYVVSNEINLYKVYKPDDLHLSSLVELENTKAERLTDSDDCYVEAVVNVENRIKICCYNFTSPCWADISVNGTIVSSGNPCANYTFTPLSSSSSQNLTFSISSCIRNEYVKHWNCILIPGNVDNKRHPKTQKFLILTAVSIGVIMLTAFALIMVLKQVLSDDL